MAIARELATSAGSATIGCDHLLVGLARIGRGVAAAVLHESGVELTKLEATRDINPNRQTPDQAAPAALAHARCRSIVGGHTLAVLK